MLDKDGYLALEEITAIPGYPGEAALADKKCVVIECAQNIPCNPCEVLCPHGAIKVGTPITHLPAVDPEKCIGCGLCVAGCPGQAIFLVDQTHEDYDAITLPYEYYPIPKKSDKVCALSRDGRKIADGEVLKVITTKRNDRTSVIEVKVPKGYGMLVRGIATDENHMMTGEAVRDAEPAMVAAIDDSTICLPLRRDHQE
ncbi:4Fe-4S dicluster domain-containing protein [Pseudoramibacter sp. HA2172]|uniref:4Fe-4S dicluster domain-containing protein n=1 Tax=Pseudoramibacter faecis TaxID=3108534 RepID=UPI002E762223|nr:4Fe-4S binding protein [Pseudoramibacter sp. HA2172]